MKRHLLLRSNSLYVCTEYSFVMTMLSIVLRKNFFFRFYMIYITSCTCACILVCGPINVAVFVRPENMTTDD